MSKHRLYVLSIVLFGLAFCGHLSAHPASATNTASITTSSAVSIDSFPNETSVYNESISVSTSCSAGYNLTIASTTNSNLYLNGDSTNEFAINPLNQSFALSSSSNANTWGFSLTNTPDSAGTFQPLSTTPTTIKTPNETAIEEGSISDIFSVYYGIHIANTPPGAYNMENNGVITYHLTLSEDCSDSLVIDFHDNAGGDTVTNLPTDEDNTYDTSNNTVTLSTKNPVRSGYTFKEWNTAADGTGNYYYPGQTVPISSSGLSGFVDLYAIWQANCPSGYICYDGNHADAGTIPNQEATNGSNVTLIASNFSRTNYGFAGWNTAPDGSGTTYGPNQTIKMVNSGGLNLYATWIEPSGTLQTWAGANSMSSGEVKALKDNRDNEVYTIAKLADNKVWTIENLRLVPGDVTFTATNTNNPTATFISDAPGTTSTTTQCSDDLPACTDQIYFYSGNMDRTKTQQPTGNDSQYAWYSYGTMYNWYTATAGHGTNSYTSTSGPNNNGTVPGDICPSGWHVPTGGSSGEYNTLVTALGGTGSAGAKTLRAYPNNFIFSGDYNPSTVIPDGRGTQGRIWEATASTNAKTYRMGYNSSSITPVNTYNKWDNFAVRCMYQGGNIPFSNTTVSFAGTGITSITFTNNDYGTETATPGDPVVSLAENATYAITATTSTGYELSSWATSATGTLGSASANPTTYIITGDSTLTATGAAIPTYTTTVNLGAGATSITFSNPNYADQTVSTTGGTVLLKRGVTYTISATYEEGYTLNTWSTTANGTIDSTTSPTTTYVITNDTTLSITTKAAELLEYTLHYDGGSGSSNIPADDEETSYHNTYEFTIDTTTIPSKFGHSFVGYSETSGASSATYVYDSSNGTFTPSTITVSTTGHSTTKTLYAVFAEDTCPANKICYFDNGADSVDGGKGTMTNQSATSNSTATLIPTNYSKTGYGFAGWITSENATPYGPNATISTGDLSSSGLKLYAKWVASTGNLQGWNGCNGMNSGDVTALTDTRDSQVYAVAKLADDNCWTIENLRLDPSTATINNQNTNNPASGFATAAASSSSSNTLCSTDDDSTCINQLQYNTNSLDRSLTPDKSTAANNVGWYSYGVYYNWFTATAGNGTMNTASGTNVTGDICPKNWHLPTSTSTGEWAALNTAANGGVTNADAGLRTYPVNLIWSGDYNGSSRTSGYSNGRYWSATGFDTNNAYRMGHQASGTKGSTPSGNYKKWDGFAVRCIYDGEAPVYSDVVVTLPQGVSSITFENNKYGTETATSGNNTVSLVQGATYTITANFAPGYELDTWTNGTNSTIGSTSQNPTTFVISDDTTLTLSTAQIPSYTVNVTIDSGVTSVGIYHADYGTQTLTPATMTDNQDGTYTGTATLYRNVGYTITGTYNKADGYVFNAWSTTGNSTIDDATSSTITFTVTGTATLTLESKQKTGETTLLPGRELNAKMKTLAEGTSKKWSDESSKIKALRMADSLPEGFTPSSTNTVSVAGSEKPIYIFFDNTNNAGIMYFYTEARDVVMNPVSSYAFSRNTALADISALSSWDTSSVTNMMGMFAAHGSDPSESNLINNIDALSNWDTSNVTNMSSMFFNASSLTNIDGAINWDTSNVKYMHDMFEFASSLTNIDGAINWDTSNVTTMSSMFFNASSLTNIDALANWDTSSVTSMGDMFQNALSLINIDGAINWDTSSVTNMNGMFSSTSFTNIDALANWDTSSVTDMSGMFGVVSSLTNIDGASNWDTSSVTDMSGMFLEASSLTNIDALANWDTSNVTSMSEMFAYNTSLTNTSGANNWDIRNVKATAGSQSSSDNNFYYMFYHAGSSSSSPYHPDFTKRSGTWDDKGTFIPGDTTPDAVTITVNFDSHISNIKFYGVFPGSSSSTTQTISTSGSTISLNRSYAYSITATLNSGYELALWDPGEHGVIPASRLTINSRTNDPTYFTPTGDTTLTATSQLVPSDVTTTVNMDSNVTKVSFCNDKYNTYNSSTGTYDCAIATTNGSTVTLKQGATYEVTTKTNSGYEVSSYTATGATITNTTGAHTDFTPSGNSSLTVTSTTNAPTHTVTVNMDSNVQYVTFTNPDWPSKTAIRNGSTVDLRENTPYTATAYTKNGYRLSTWSTTSGGTLSSTTANPATYTITDDATLTVTCETIPSHQVTVNMDSNTTSVSFYNASYGVQTATASNPNVSLREGVEYTITGSYATGYEFSSWATSSGGTLGSTTDNSTTYSVTNDATITAMSGIRPTYQTTVTIDEGVTSVSFLNADYGTIILAPATMTDNQDGTYTGTATLYKNIEYTITGTYNTADGYVFNAWSTTGSSTIGDATASTTNFTVTDTATLTLTSKQKTGETMLLPGKKLNAKMKTLAEGTSKEYYDESSKIKTLRMADSLPSGFTPSSTNTVSVAGSEKPIYIFFDNTSDAGIMYFYTDAKDICMNQDSSYAFHNNTALADISALSSWDTSSVTSMRYMFEYARALTNIDSAANWDTSSVRDMSNMFENARALTNIDGASNWDTGSVTDMSYMFQSARALTNIDSASNWDVSSVTSMSSMFSYASALTNINALANWDTSSVTSMYNMFQNASSLTNIDGASNWDTGSVKDMSYMFWYASALTNINALANWDTSSVTNMSYMFEYASSLTNIDGASNWDTSSVTNMSYMFVGAKALINIDGASNWDTGSVRNMLQMFSQTNSNVNGSAISNWDVRAVTATAGSSSNNYFACMFGYGLGECNDASSSTSFSQYTDIPNFTSRSGTWDGHGTFIPDDTTTGPTVVTITVNFDSHISNIKFYGIFPGSSSSTTQTISTSGSTISLNRGNSYRITATLSSGYELALWDPGEHGKIPANRLTMNSRDYDYTNFTPTGDTTLTATSQLVPSDVTTTVNMDSNIKQVSFCNDKYNTYNSSTVTYDCAIATTNGSTVTLKQGATYEVTTKTNSGYEVSSYTATGATITNTTGAHTDFTPSGTSSLTVTSTSKATTHTVTVNMGSNVSYVTFINPDWPTKTAIRNGSTVELRNNTSYIITAITPTGYELSSWSTTANGTLASTSANPTTYTITGDSTLTVASQVIPSYTVTVNMDSNVSSVGFYNANYGTQTVSTNGGIVSLKRGVEYTITGSYATGYEFSSWSTTANGTLGSTSSATTTYTVTNTATLSLTSQEELPEPPSTCNTPVPNITYMQDITSSNRSTVLAGLTEEAPYYLRDSRDGEPYCVSKLKDGNLWLLDNLRLDLTDSDVLNNTTASNTHASATSLGYLKNGGGTTSDQYAITGVVEWTGPTYASSKSYSDPLIVTSYKDTINSNSSYNYGNGSHKYGVYYNYCAASAGSYCYGNGTSEGTSSGNATEDLCPAGWRMPTGDISGEYNSLYGYYNTTQIATNTASLQYNLSTPLSGYFFYDGSATGQSGYGEFWSSTRYDDVSMYYLGVFSRNVYPTGYSSRNSGLSMRCLLDS